MKVPVWLDRLLLSSPMSYLLPYLTTRYFNHRRLSGELRTMALPDEPWARAEAKLLLQRSEDRMKSIESKGPGLATVAAVVGAGAVAAVAGGWDESTLVGRILLVAVAWYSAFSLLTPISLVGPQPRDTIDLAHLGVAARSSDPERYLAAREVEAAQRNVRRTQRLANLQDAARLELTAALACLLLWALLGPLVGELTVA